MKNFQLALSGCSFNDRKVVTILMQILFIMQYVYVASVVIPYTGVPFSASVRQIVDQKFIHEVWL